MSTDMVQSVLDELVGRVFVDQHRARELVLGHQIVRLRQQLAERERELAAMECERDAALLAVEEVRAEGGRRLDEATTPGGP